MVQIYRAALLVVFKIVDASEEAARSRFFFFTPIRSFPDLVPY
jgi:hypothetical protein